MRIRMGMEKAGERRDQTRTHGMRRVISSRIGGRGYRLGRIGVGRVTCCYRSRSGRSGIRKLDAYRRRIVFRFRRRRGILGKGGLSKR